MHSKNVLKEHVNSQAFFRTMKQLKDSFVGSQFLKVNRETINSDEDLLLSVATDNTLDLSMLSLKEENIGSVYYLPDSDNLKSMEDIKVWVEDMKCRRLNNRMDVYRLIENFKSNFNDLSFDDVTGERYLFQSHDYRMELEMTRYPLGKNFLKNTNVTPFHRSAIIDYLFSLVDNFDEFPYTVALGMSYADRYVKIKGKKLCLADYKFMVLSCWFISCKYDLIRYQPLEQICEAVQISDPKIILDFEVDIVQTIDFYLGITTPIDFLRPLSLLKQRKFVSHNIAKFFIDLCLYSYDLAGHPSHIIAAASYCLSMALSLHSVSVDDAWIDLMKIYTGVDIKDIKPVISLLGHTIVTTDIVKDFPALYKFHKTVIEVLNERHVDILALSKS